MIQVKELIVSDLSRKGTGQNQLSPIRSVFEVYSKEGDLLAINDSLGNYSVEDLISCGTFCMSKNDVPIEDLFKKWKF
jgi:hypothetical protein